MIRKAITTKDFFRPYKGETIQINRTQARYGTYYYSYVSGISSQQCTSFSDALKEGQKNVRAIQKGYEPKSLASLRME